MSFCFSTGGPRMPLMRGPPPQGMMAPPLPRPPPPPPMMMAPPMSGPPQSPMAPVGPPMRPMPLVGIFWIVISCLGVLFISRLPCTVKMVMSVSQMFFLIIGRLEAWTKWLQHHRGPCLKTLRRSVPVLYRRPPLFTQHLLHLRELTSRARNKHAW